MRTETDASHHQQETGPTVVLFLQTLAGVAIAVDRIEITKKRKSSDRRLRDFAADRRF
jgi:hypothetical protein